MREKNTNKDDENREKKQFWEAITDEKMNKLKIKEKKWMKRKNVNWEEKLLPWCCDTMHRFLCDDLVLQPWSHLQVY